MTGGFGLNEYNIFINYLKFYPGEIPAPIELFDLCRTVSFRCSAWLNFVFAIFL
jgi:hypothetical protein